MRDNHNMDSVELPKTKKINLGFLKRSIDYIKKNKLLAFVVSFVVIGLVTSAFIFASSASFSDKLNSKNPERSHSIIVEGQGELTAVLSPDIKGGGKGKNNNQSDNGFRLVLTLTDEQNNVLSSFEASQPNQQVQLTDYVAPGNYTLKVSSLDTLSKSGINYDISVTYPDPEKEPQDTLPPTLFIEQPTVGVTVSGEVTVSGTSSDDVEVYSVRVRFIGQNWRNALGTTSWSALLDSTLVANGSITIEVEAVDTAGNVTSQAVAVLVSNEQDTGDVNPDSFLSGDIYEAKYSISDASGWSTETSGESERFVYNDGFVECYAGGYPANTHYTRVRRKLPERDNFAAGKRFSIQSTFELPSDFYDNHESYMRLLTTDNFPGTYSESGETIGANDSDDWRVGFTIYGGDSLFRVISVHQNKETIVLWKAQEQLPVGLHKVKLNFDPAKDNTGAWELYIDDVLVGSETNVQTVPASLLDSEIFVTRAGGCIDGASKQDTKEIQVNLHEIVFRAER